MTRDPEVLVLVKRTERLLSQAASLHGDLITHQSHLTDFLQRAEQVSARLGQEHRD
jgi:hypothetical protein